LAVNVHITQPQLAEHPYTDLT